MDSTRYEGNALEYLRTNDLAPSTVRGPDTAEGSVPGTNHTEMKGETVDNDALTEEREEEIERWMTNIKDFIRKIDVSRL